MDKKVLKFAQESIVVEFGEEKHNVRFPTSLELIDYTEKTKGIDQGDIRKTLEANHDFLEALGLPKVVSQALTAKQTQDLFKDLVGN